MEATTDGGFSISGRRLGLEEREEIRVGLVRGESLRQIARRIERPVSTIAREADRNGGQSLYVAACAQRRAERCARRPATARLANDLRWLSGSCDA